ncbi:MAG: hypothetical protein ACJAXS_003391, partial [Colwellia sp.]
MIFSLRKLLQNNFGEIYGYYAQPRSMAKHFQR